MSVIEMAERMGITEEDLICTIKSKEITNRGNTAEIKRKTNGTMVVYEIKKEKR